MRPDEVYAILKGKIVKLSEKVDGIPTPLTYKGSVDAVESLPANPGIGWMYNISQKSIYGEAGMNVAWTGTIWDPLGPIVDMSMYMTKEDADEKYQPKGTDKTLTKSGEAADAKVVGDKITELKGDISNLQDLGLIIKNGVVYDRWEEK